MKNPPNKQPNVSASERQSYEEAISKLSASNALIRFLLMFILVLAIIGNVLIWLNGQKTNQEAELSRQRQTEILKVIQAQTGENKENSQRILNYLNCVGTVEVKDRTKDFIKKCFTDATTAPPVTLRGEVDSSSSGSSGDTATGSQEGTSSNSDEVSSSSRPNNRGRSGQTPAPERAPHSLPFIGPILPNKACAFDICVQ